MAPRHGGNGVPAEHGASTTITARHVVALCRGIYADYGAISNAICYAREVDTNAKAIC